MLFGPVYHDRRERRQNHANVPRYIFLIRFNMFIFHYKLYKQNSPLSNTIFLYFVEKKFDLWPW